MKISIAFWGLLGMQWGCASASNFVEDFSVESKSKWIQSSDSRYGGQEWVWGAEVEGGSGISVGKKHKFYGLSHLLDDAVPVNHEDGFVVQYEVKYANGATCSGSYLKLLIGDDGFTPEKLVESSGYSIMFGPDICGSNNKVHLIFRQENPVTNKFEEKHMAKTVSAVNDKMVHMYTLIVKPDNTFMMMVDGEMKMSGSLTSDDDFKPSFNVPKEIDDPEDKKPAGWVDKAKIPDPEKLEKPDDWDDVEYIVDEEAVQPEEWDEEDDGPWEPPLKKNPNYKGQYKAPMIDNPDYKGEWAPRKIANPAYFEEPNPVSTIKPIKAIAIEILANDEGITFDNIQIGNDIDAAMEYGNNVFLPKQKELQAKFKEEKQKEKEELRLKAYEEGGIGGVLQYYQGYAMDLLIDLYENNTTAFFGLGIVCVLIPGIYFCGKTPDYDGMMADLDASAKHKKDDDDEQPEDGEEEEEEEEGGEGEDVEEDEDDEEGDDDDEDAGDKGGLRRIPKAN